MTETHTMTTGAFEATPNRSKANFDGVYNGLDPREYFRVLGGLNYVIPDLAKDVFRSIIYRRGEELRRPVKVLDLGCSYGINSALIRYPIDIQRLADRYGNPAMAELDAAQVASLDACYFRSWPAQTTARFVGLDRSTAAVSYAQQAGLLNGGISSNFEEVAPSKEEARLLQGTDIIISTGAVGYITERTFRQILDCQTDGSRPTIASFVLRMFPYNAVASELARFGLVTEKLNGVTFVQRRFNSMSEYEATAAHLKRLGIETRGKESEGLLHAELYVSRPPEAVAAVPLVDLVSVTSGASRKYGRCYREPASSEMNAFDN